MIIDKVHTYVEKNLKKTNKKRKKYKNKRKVMIATGVAATEVLRDLACYVETHFDFLETEIVTVVNDFFGETITVSGLITGGDLIKQLSNRNVPEIVMITENMLRRGETVFLDNVTVSDVEEKLKTKIVPCGDSGAEFVNKLLGVD